METRTVRKPAVVIMVILGILLTALGCGVLYFNAQAAKVIELPADVKISRNIQYEITRAERDTFRPSDSYGLTQTGAGSEYFTVEGWAGVPGEDVRVFNTQVLLRNEVSGLYLQIKTAYVEDGEEPETDNGGASFARGNFVAKVKDEKLQAGIQYRVCLWYQNDGHNELVETDTFLER
ncbi:MAG: hypothetical protein IJ860_04540 [Eubacterium sp.]|nr:hypothetical protein [Eubacterium sp.]